LNKLTIPAKNNTKPRIVILGPGPTQIGGVTTFIEILLSSPILNGNYELIWLDTTRAQEDVGLGGRFSLMNMTYLTRQIFQFIEIGIRMRPKLVHLPVTSGLAFWKAAVFILLGQILGMKTLAHLHGGMFDIYYRNSRPSQQKFIGWVFHRADVIVALSERWRRFLLDEIGADLCVEVVNNPVDHMFARALDQVSDNDSSKEEIILFLGSLGKRKGVFDILKAVPLVRGTHPHARFFFAGREETRGEEQRINQVYQENQLAESVQFLGQITGLSKLELFQRAMIFLLPSYGENMPFSLLEAMAVGLPVITTPVGAIPEVVKDGNNGFIIQPGDYKALAERISQLLNDHHLRTAMSKANIARIRQDFLPEVAMEHIDKVYRQLLSVAK
jgi:glycosyltransferase involved in cell wall biosynthesis